MCFDDCIFDEEADGKYLCSRTLVFKMTALSLMLSNQSGYGYSVIFYQDILIHVDLGLTRLY